jgi:sugar lactone lactonase YvrE
VCVALSLLLGLPLVGQPAPAELPAPTSGVLVASCQINGGRRLEGFRREIGCEKLQAITLAEYRVADRTGPAVFDDLVAHSAPAGTERLGLDRGEALCAAVWRVSQPPGLVLLNVRPAEGGANVVWVRYAGDALSLGTLPTLDWAEVPPSALPAAKVIAGTGKHGYNGDGMPATEANIWEPCGVAERSDGSIVICDRLQSRVRVIRPDGKMDTLVESVEARGAVVDADDHLYISRSGGNWQQGLLRVDVGGEVTQAFAFSEAPKGVARAPNGTLYAPLWDDTIVVAKPLGEVQRIAGIPGEKGVSRDGGPAVEAVISDVMAVTCDPRGALYFGDGAQGRLRTIKADGTIHTVATLGTAVSALVATADGRLFIGETTSAWTGRLFVWSPEGGLRPITKLPEQVSALNLARNGDLLICGFYRVYRLSADALTPH